MDGHLRLCHWNDQLTLGLLLSGLISIDFSSPSACPTAPPNSRLHLTLHDLFNLFSITTFLFQLRPLTDQFHPNLLVQILERDGNRKRERKPTIQVIYLYQVRARKPTRRLTVLESDAHFGHQLWWRTDQGITSSKHRGVGSRVCGQGSFSGNGVWVWKTVFDFSCKMKWTLWRVYYW